MGILTRHVVFELLKVFCLVLAAMTALLMIFGITKEAVDQGLGLKEVARMLPFFVPEAMKITVPGTILFASCSVYGRMSAANEVVAIKSLGISPMVIIWPGLVLGALVSLASVWLNDVAASWGLNGIQRVVIEAAEEIAYGVLKREGSYSTPHVSIVVQGVEGRRLIQPIVTIQSSGSSPSLTLQAEWAELRSDLENKELIIVSHNGQFSVNGVVGNPTYIFPDTDEKKIALADFSKEREKSAEPSRLPLNRIAGRIEEQGKLIELFEQERASKAAFQMLTGDFRNLANPEWKKEHDVRRYLRGEYYRLVTEPHRRWSSGLCCLVFVLMGSTWSIRWGHAELLSNFFACFMPVIGLYYPLLAFGINSAKEGTLPPHIVWLGDVVFLLAGLWLLRRVLRY